MRFYKGDIVEVLQGSNIGNRYRLTNVRLSFDNVTIVLDTGIKDGNWTLKFNVASVMLYHRPFNNYLIDLITRIKTFINEKLRGIRTKKA
jgi:hypothetical protein